MRKIILLLAIVLSSMTYMTAKEMALADSLMAETSFVLRGEVSKKWRGKELKFAVTDPVKNTGHELSYKNGQFEMSVPMRGYIQEIYMYIDGTVTIPVCAGDTINMVIGDDDMYLSASDHGQDLDL